MKRLILLCIFSAFFGYGAFAQPMEEPVASDRALSAAEFLASLEPQSGHIQLPGGIASLNLSSKFRYLSPESTERLLVKAWGNPPGNKTLGMIIPTSVSPLTAAGWGVVISYADDGHVSDADADSIDYDAMLSELIKHSESENEARIEQGYGSALLVGWAEAPRYDKATHKFYWAKEFATDNRVDNSLNYNIRVLGREGVLVLNAVATMSQLPVIKAEIPELLAMTEFTAGNRYADFNANTDRVAEYGLAALVAGGVAAKMGMFAKLGALLIAFKKIILLAVVGIAGMLSRRFGGKKP